ncbi:ADP-ribosylglycohydrolase family protein [Deinococcus soli (ex Cha et al. 2016)]|uniref:ADP-ribosylglycohydrolase n=2 Tax=Deinococcus soli (ex Cha et al. 2016) TaxID=1309411 RepID=A0ACC6KGL6_9DEIO|nr:ADP-ribosylglycohydrolase family protein [Deinococcus soli (ex Cha et al. 2016)]MDR6218122.1 ADP-ribosylglycohydrolase [Deinococcus soli (ex Cha et al. 2016)]MDR6328862.1 ADP-ribosylglycohydrolase [Deinococcus soli (ex Cha et al. 2016)]MDR6751650.1 ADP-ribosylglycohydrolase [Deinococcus soli (ex Cha et al. 2016)]
MIDLHTLLGLAIGDALGAPTEFKTAAEVQRRWPDGFTTFQPGSPFGFAAGEATDDTQMTLATLSGLQDSASPPVPAALRHFITWNRSGPPDVGRQTHTALLARAPVGGWVTWLAEGGDAAGNGGLMRAAAPFIHGLRGESLRRVTLSTVALTHPDPRCLISSVLLADLLERLQTTGDVDRAARAATDAAITYVQRSGLDHLTEDGLFLDRDARDDTRTRTLVAARWPQAVQSAAEAAHACVTSALQGKRTTPSGYTLDTLQNALATGTGETYLDVVLPHALRGGDSDTTAAVAGALAGGRRLPLPDDLAATVRVGHTWGDWQRQWTVQHAAQRLLRAHA